MPRVLLLAATTGYQTRAFGEAAERLGVDLIFATDRCRVLEDPWRDAAVAIRFQHEEAATSSILEAARRDPVDGVLAVGDRPTVIAARVLEGLGLPGHPPDAAAVARSKLATRERLHESGLLVPAYQPVSLSADARAVVNVDFPLVVKPLTLSGSRGVMRADDAAGLVAAFYRLRSLLHAPDIQAEWGADADPRALVEEFIEGHEFAVEGLMSGGRLQTLAIFDKPDPLDGPFFEETIYVTPSTASEATQLAIVQNVAWAARAIGLRHGPIHAECRVNARGVWVLEVAARPIGGLCARALRFRNVRHPSGTLVSLEELLLRHALGERCDDFVREPDASGVMMIPIPRRGILRRVDGIEAAREVGGIVDVRITAKIDQLLVPLPEGASYLGFIFSSAPGAAEADRALRAAHARLAFVIDPEVRMVQSAHA